MPTSGNNWRVAVHKHFHRNQTQKQHSDERNLSRQHKTTYPPQIMFVQQIHQQIWFYKAKRIEQEKTDI